MSQWCLSEFVPEDILKGPMFHIYPVNDEKEHELDSSECWCNPEIQWKNPDSGEIYSDPLVIHNAQDCRELIEHAEEIKNGPSCK